MTDFERWEALLTRLGAKSGAESIWRELADHYAETHRAYHTLDHVRDCLALFDEARGLAERPLEVEAALWLHDAIYDPHASDNEERSARWAVRTLQDVGVPKEVALHVSELILATRHDDTPSSADAALLADIDLSILGRTEREFDAYGRQIRQEYHWVPEQDFRKGRAEVLRRFAAREFIYQTVSFRDRYEAQARKNLARSLCQLEAKGSRR